MWLEKGGGAGVHPGGVASGHLESSSNHLQVKNQVTRPHQSVLVLTDLTDNAVALTNISSIVACYRQVRRPSSICIEREQSMAWVLCLMTGCKLWQHRPHVKSAAKGSLHAVWRAAQKVRHANELMQVVPEVLPAAERGERVKSSSGG